MGPEPGALGGQRRRQDRRIDARDREHLRLAAGAGAPTTPKGCGGLEGQPRGRFWGGVEMGARTRVGAGGGEASPWLPGGQHRRRPAVAKENALPGHGRRVVESNGGREGPKAKRRGERARPRPWVRGSSVAAAAAEPERRVLRQQALASGSRCRPSAPGPAAGGRPPAPAPDRAQPQSSVPCPAELRLTPPTPLSSSPPIAPQPPLSSPPTPPGCSF